MPIALHDPHHGQLSQALVYLFEKRLGIHLYRPMGREWYDRGAYYHPLEAEAIANLTPASSAIFSATAPNPHEWQKSQEGLDYFNQDNLKFRWLPFDRVKEANYLVCTTDRNEQRFADLKRNICPRAKVIRYIGNGVEQTDPKNWDIGLMATQRYYDQFKGSKPCILYHPEFDLQLYRYSEPLTWWPGQMGEIFGSKAVVRNWLNFTHHHREAGSPWEIWQRYHGYCNEFGYIAICHGLGTPPPDVKVEMDVILDTCFDRMGRPELKDRSKWPDLRWNQGEPGSHKQIAELMRLSSMACHIKRSPPEGYGFLVHCLAAMGRPPIVEQTAYEKLSAYKFLQHRETCLYVSGDDATDKSNLRWALQPENNLRMAETLHRRFRENVSFDGEARAIAKLL